MLVRLLGLTKSYGTMRSNFGGPGDETSLLDIELFDVFENPDECFLQHVLDIRVFPNISSGHGSENGHHFVEQHALGVTLSLTTSFDEAMNDLISTSIIFAFQHEMRPVSWDKQ